MRRRPKYTAADFPPPGTVLTFPLADGRHGACRVLRVGQALGDAVYALAVLTEYIHDRTPTLRDSGIRKILHLTHHSWSNRPEILWIGEPPPETFRPIGIIPINEHDDTLESHSFSSWASFPLQRLLQWRWDHDRDALLAEEAIEKAKREKELAAKAERRARILAKTTLPMIQERKRLFPRWHGSMSPATIKSLEQPIRDFLAALIAMKNPTRRDITRELRVCIKALNDFDNANQHPIETVEREDIYHLFDEILTVAKHPDLIEKIDQWRDW
jgi:hypothetical protein